MKRILIISLILILSFITGFLYFENKKLQVSIEQSEDLNEEQKKYLEMKEMQLYYSKNSVSTDLAVDYESWVISTTLADQLHEDSNGKFQKEWGIFLGEITQQRGVDPYIVYELLRTETGGTFDPGLVGPQTRFGHAYGMAQFMKNTAPWIAEMADLPYEDKLLFDPLYSIQLSVEYLHYLYDQFENWDHALTAYHRGVGGLKTYIDNNGHAKSAYAVEIQERAEEFDLLTYSP
ncbi:lytic transglycosylase domain-containing protein [Halalkalibacter kiskunsagensis]|uniref:Lytic transglycosylase domain-containing protein n=1 Tax=Halalkalibacter kiskunsagensis TaxID=1548599 RepID=A0ABV6KGH2_9BACI